MPERGQVDVLNTFEQRNRYKTLEVVKATALVPSPPSMDIFVALSVTDALLTNCPISELPHRYLWEIVDAAICGNILHSI